MKVQCRLCDVMAETELYTHIRTAHGITAEQYLEKFPDADLLSKDAARFLKEKDLVVSEGGLKERIDFFEEAIDHMPEDQARLGKKVMSAFYRGRRGVPRLAEEFLSDESMLAKIEEARETQGELSWETKEQEERWGKAVVKARKVQNYWDLKVDIPLETDEHVPNEMPNFIFPELVRHVVLGLKAGERLLLVGPTGSGKSSLVEQVASLMNWPVLRAVLSSGLTKEDLVGTWTIQDGATIFREGLLPRAMKMGAICLLDEVDGMEPDVGFAIHQVLEPQGNLVLLQDGARVIRPHPDFRVVATANTIGTGDDTGLYTGTRILNAAFLDRFDSVFRFDYPDANVEAEILRRKAPDCPEFAINLLIRIGQEIREKAAGQTLHTELSTRRLISAAQKYQQTGNMLAALRLTILNRFGEDMDRPAVASLIERVINEEQLKKLKAEGFELEKLKKDGGSPF